MSVSNKLISKEAFIRSKRPTINKLTTQLINNYYADKKKSKRINWAKGGLWSGVGIFLLGLLLLITTIALFALYFRKKETFFENNSEWFFGMLFGISLTLTIPGLIVLLIGQKAKKYVLKDVITKFDKYKLIKKLFNFFTLGYKENIVDENNKIHKNYDLINFYKNTHNFKNFEFGFAPIHKKYEQYEALTDNQYLKMQNVYYEGNIWHDLASINHKLKKQLIKAKSRTYGQLIEQKLSVKRFGIAVKLRELNPEVNVSFFDKDNFYTPSDYTSVELPKAYEKLLLKSNNHAVLKAWLDQKNNLEFLNEIFNELTISQISVPNTKANKKYLLNNLSFLIRNTEAFIWFDIPFELIDLIFEAKTINKEDIIETLTNKLMDDFYLIYLALQLLVPFGLEISVKEEIVNKPLESDLTFEGEKEQNKDNNQENNQTQSKNSK
ncbi:MAG2810 family protein [Mycoplasmopsis fermentans]|uniref:DUF3137 domain-containing protein n=2 Tax=Mycoplasmopsis fermentans TaxID=2115 RepID=C4XEW1_MYCFP|nr:hypothetical protein [Mycoplasmopsis fermentans]VEU66693.1 Uncharacterised protein [Mesomycoplasma conjunctivae]ADN68990.1 hypothetical membrane spanning protein [Mycoplasmopsis fermentans JER]ADV34498.1 Conserved Hypothetical Protein [Mycoplasmopsis fermentans M64]VEU64054.1 Uncharacterised protein [Mycoplasmopsis fermentans]BAH69683.1 hypothetical protein MBIO_0418 [Mycoplasmopsis fermentans PG18]